MSERVEQIMQLVLQYGQHFAEANLHQSASRADISATAAAHALAKIRMTLTSLEAAAQLSPRCDRIVNGHPCGLNPPCPDCGPACHDVPEGA